MEKVRTVSDTKRDFYSYHLRPINSVYRRVVEELMVEMHLLSVNVDFRVDPIYRLGVVTTFDRFMQGYRPEKDLESIFTGICKSTGGDPQEYRSSAKTLLEWADGKSIEDIHALFNSSLSINDLDKSITESIDSITKNQNFKYSRLFAIGVYSLLEKVNPEKIKDKSELESILKKISESLNLPEEKISKDLELYIRNLEKISQMLIVIEEAIAADRKRAELKNKEELLKKEPKKEESPSEEKSTSE